MNTVAQRTIPISDLALSGLERRYLLEAFDSGMLSGVGGFVTRFEEAFKQRIGAQHAVAVANGTVALEVALDALGIGAGDEVIVPAFTFVSPAAAVRRSGAEVVLADIDPANWTIDPYEVRSLLTHRTAAVMAVDVVGHPCDYDRLFEVLPDSVVLIEDAAEAHGSKYKGKYTGSFGVAATFSFFGNKTIACGEGGMILTNLPGLASTMRRTAAHGLVPNQGYTHDRVGTNARMNNLSCAVALAQTERWDELVAARNRVATWYDQHIRPEWGFGSRPSSPWATMTCWLYCLTHPRRDQVVAFLKRRGVDARPAFRALSDLPLYASSRRGDYPIAEQVGQQAFFLPTSALMTEDDVRTVAATLREAVNA